MNKDEIKLGLVEKYYDYFNRLYSLIHKYKAGDMSLKDVRRIINNLEHINKLAEILEYTGYYLYMLKEKIISEDVEFFFDHDYTQYIKPNNDLVKPYLQMVINMIGVIKEAWIDMIEEDKKSMKTVVKVLLLTYIEYTYIYD